jgi:hypothetical protein
MNDDFETTPAGPRGGSNTWRPERSWTGRVLAGFFSWLCMAVGFYGLNILMRERPQFAGEPVRFSSVELIQESPSVVMRRIHDDVSVMQETQPEQTQVSFSMKARRDYRGLRTIIDMEGRFEGRYTLTNPHPDTVFVLFKCPHPRSEKNSSYNLNASALSLVSSTAGIEENTATAWFWSGEIEAQKSVQITVSYRAATITGVRYLITSSRGIPIQAHRVEIQVEDLPSMLFESGEGAAEPRGDRVVWERNNFLPPDHFAARIGQTRNLYSALHQLLEVGPVVSLLFMISVMAVMSTRRQISALQILTISAGYAFYFPLILYLSARFTFAWALIIAAAAPGLLLLNYARWLLGFRLGVLGGIIFLALYQVFPTLAAFTGWNRGLMLLCLGGVTLSVLINLQNRILKRTAAMSILWLSLLAPWPAVAQDVQVMIPGKLVNPISPDREKALAALFSFGTAQYRLLVEDRFVEVKASLAVEVFRKGETGLKLFKDPVFLSSSEISPNVRLIVSSNSFYLDAVEPGRGNLDFTYRVPLTVSGNKVLATIPLLNTPSGHATLAAKLPNLEFQHATLWKKVTEGVLTQYELGLAGPEPFTIGWAGKIGETAPRAGLETPTAASLDQLYGIRITESQQLTVINSDGSCTHFAEFLLPPFHPPAFDVTLPVSTQVISVSVDGVEKEKPPLAGRQLRIPLDVAGPRPEVRRVSLRLALPKVHLAFIGFTELELPQTGATIGTLKWIVVLPSGFRTQVISSGLDLQRQPPDLSSFGDYGRVLKSHPQISFLKNLLPPIPVRMKLKYYQQVSGINPELTESAGVPEK